MNAPRKFSFIAGLAFATLASGSAFGATTILSDNYAVTTSGTGFGLNAGVNTGINPPTTRLTGSAVANLRYMQTATARPASAYDINSSRLRVTTGNSIGRFTLSANGSAPFDFGPSLGSSEATPSSPMIYDVKISMRNDATGNPRFSFGIATVEGDINNMDFALQMYRASTGNNFYTLQKRIDRGSFNGTTTTDGTGDLNAALATTSAGTVATMMDFLIRVTDAGSESGANYNSRIQVSTNNGASWIYDSDNDAALFNRFRFDGAGRFFVFDQAPNTTGNVFYDGFSVTWNSGPRTWKGGGANGNWSTAANWGGAIPVNGSELTFNGTTRQTSTNDLSGLSAPWLKFNNGGFALFGNELILTDALTNAAGNNTLNGNLSWNSTAAKAWSIASGSEVVLNNTTAIENGGDHTLYDGGTLRLKGTMNIGQATSVNPAFVINKGKHIVDGGTFATRGGYRIGANASALNDETVLILTNGANFNITSSASNMRVGNSLNGGTGQLDMNNSTLALGGGSVAIPYTAGAVGVVNQTGGIVSGGAISFSDPNAGTGSYTIKNGTLQTTQISKNSGAGSASIYFDNATLRPESGASSAFLSGLDVAQIQSGGLTIDATSDIVIAQTLSGSGALTKNGGAQLTLSGNNSFSGGAILNAGTLNIGDNSALGSGMFTINGGTIAPSGGAQQIGNAVSVGGNVSISGADDLTFSGAISGSGSVTKNGSGVLQLSGANANTFSGGAIVNAGTLSLAKSSGVNALACDVTIAGGALQLNAANQISDSASVTISSSGIFDLNGLSETVASISSSSSASQIALGGGTLTVGDASASTFAGTISGSGDLVKQGSGTITLSGANTYTGNTTISAGTLALGAGGSIASSPTITIANGATLDVAANNFSLGGTQTLSRNANSGTGTVNGSLTLSSGATLALLASGTGGTVGNLNVSGGLTLNNNTITINVSGNALDTGSYTLVTYSGSRNGSFNLTPTITGSGIKAGLKALILETSGVIALKVVPNETNTVFRVMTYNIHSGQDPVTGAVDTTRTANFILSNNVDLVSLNEVARNMPRSNGRDLIAELSQKTGMAYVFSNNIPSLSGDDEFGNAILSKYPILFRDHRLLPKVGSNEQRGWLKAIVDVKGKYISFWTTHLDFHADNTERLMCGTNFNTWLADETVPTIICGDFNDTPNTPIYDLMDTKWNDIWTSAGDGSLGRTVPSPGYPNNLNARIDYIWKQQGASITPTNAFVGYGIEASDHYPVLTDFILTSTTNHANGFSFPFNEGSGTNTTDSIGSLKGTFTAGGASWNTNSPSGQAGDYSVYFNGSRKITAQDPKQILGTNGFNDDYTLQAWVKVAVNYAPAQRAIMFQYERRPGFSFSINTNRTLHTTTFKVKDISSTATLPNDGNWHHVAVVHTDGANMKFYIDGGLAATVAYTNGCGYRTDSTITMGSAADGANPFTGYLDRVKFENRALTPSELDYLPGSAKRSGESINSFDSWMAANELSDASADADGDGQSNYAEFIAGTDPKDRNSALRINGAKSKDGQTVLTWSSVGNIRYRIQYTDDLRQPFKDIVRDAASEIDLRPAGQAGTQSFTDSEIPANSTRYYRIKVIPQGGTE